MQQFQIGDVVKLKSDGPKMTVSKYIKSSTGHLTNLVECLWFVNEEVKEGVFNEGTLEKS